MNLPHPPSEAEGRPDAVAGRALLDERLKRLTPTERDAFLEAVKRCDASSAGGESERKQGS